MLADGIECARMDLAESSKIRFEINKDFTLLEILGHDGHGDLLLGTYIRSEDDEAAKYSIRLAGGQQISLTITESAENTLTMEISYREARRSWQLRDWWLGLTAP